MEKKTIEDELKQSINKHDEITRDSILKAEGVQFKDIPDQILSYDHFGFLKDAKTKTQNTLSQEDINKANSRLCKWTIMLEVFNSYKKSHYNKLKSRTRKGVPDSLRTTVWQLFGHIDEFKSKNPTKYQDLLQGENAAHADESVIIRDLHRTYPKHVLFMNILGKGQRELYCVLTAYSKYNTQTGYVQGMGFITALFLTYMDEESAFWMLHSLMINYNLQCFFTKDFPGLRKSLFVFLSLMKKNFPKVYEQLKIHKVYPTMYAAQWFFTFFACVFKFDILVRIFDLLLLEGFKVIYRIALGIIKIYSEVILKKRSFEDIMDELRDITKLVNVHNLLKEAFDISLSRNEIEKHELLYEKLIKEEPKNNEILVQVLF